ncbi:MAG: 3-hydroxyacyl-CoA dehydrogenase/enoyl-CoA hydratase family protein [Proteobacteria bacterium]|jgi:3-hydroxyacyl-CoA dehydrogenase|nr:3-hydroxyacyl-CoA dehydrogenase NAD-binding domain-containing protein [Alphaproteobacteria bacterium]NCC03304.1 3-hydroxyacyl-CoA dehydrogenase/enoyl-CoA hydratase family protein [Pseudomonadota bacterium]
MPAEIRKVAVIGSGVMGSQIAAQVANAGKPVLLLDIVPKGAEDRNMLAKAAIEKMKKGPFMHPSAAQFIEVGNTEDDLEKIKDCDWVLEAVLEDLKIKADLYKRVDAIRTPGTIVSSNTSTIPLEHLIRGQSEAFAKDFMITHFFNPVRVMRLLELITGPKTDAKSIALMSDFCDRALGKGVVPCNDTPGFIANRLGMFWLQSAVNAAMDLGLTVEEADAVCGKPMGIPGTGVFGLIDLIGLDLMPLIGKSLLSTLGPNDVYRRIYQEPELFAKMIADGYTGRKGKGGYYRMSKTDDGKKIKESINLETGEYALSEKPVISTLDTAGKDLRALCEATDKIGQFAWRVLSETLSYAFNLVPATVQTVTLVDEGMRLGYNWKFGPFELMDKLGADWIVARLKSEGRPVPAFLAKAAGKTFYRIQGGRREFLQLDGSYAPIERAAGVISLSDLKLATQPVEKNGSASLWDIGDGVLCLEFTSKANALNNEIFQMIHKSIELIGDGKGKWKGLVVFNEGRNFSVGANLEQFLTDAKAGNYGAIETFIKQGQEVYRALRFAPFPSVAAPSGAAMGGGCEITLHCSAVQAYCELAIGLVEVNVGLIPGWGGCTQMLCRAFAEGDVDGVPPINRVFKLLMTATASSSGADAKALGLIRKTDKITMNIERLLADAKARVLEMAQSYKAPEEAKITLPGPAAKGALELILEAVKSSPHEVTIGKMVADVLCGENGGLSGEVSEQQIMAAERDVFVKLVKLPESIARIEHMLAKGKPLKN